MGEKELTENQMVMKSNESSTIKMSADADKDLGENQNKETVLIKEDTKKVQDEVAKEKIASYTIETRKELKEDISALSTVTDEGIAESIKFAEDEIKLENPSSSFDVKSQIDISTSELDKELVRKASIETRRGKDKASEVEQTTLSTDDT